MLDLLKAAVAARIASWDAEKALEEALGYPDGNLSDAADSAIYDKVTDLSGTPDRNDDPLFIELGWIASGLPGVDFNAITQEHVDQLVAALAEVEADDER